MQRQNLSEEVAYAKLRKTAMDKNLKLIEVAQRMLDVVGASPVQQDGRVIGATVSIGYATFPIEPTLLAVPWERAINLVDTALYLAKAHGRNRAYGVRLLHARDETQLDAIGKALEAARVLEQEGRSAEVIDLRVLRPLDSATIMASVRPGALGGALSEPRGER